MLPQALMDAGPPMYKASTQRLPAGWLELMDSAQRAAAAGSSAAARQQKRSAFNPVMPSSGQPGLPFQDQLACLQQLQLAQQLQSLVAHQGESHQQQQQQQSQPAQSHVDVQQRRQQQQQLPPMPPALDEVSGTKGRSKCSSSGDKGSSACEPAVPWLAASVVHWLAI